MTFDAGHCNPPELGLFNDSYDRENKYDGHCYLGRNAKRTVSLDESDLHKNQPQGEKKTNQRQPEQDHPGVVFKETDFAFEKKNSQNAQVSNHAKNRNRDSVNL
jgi:hypothetical protein